MNPLGNPARTARERAERAERAAHAARRRVFREGDPP